MNLEQILLYPACFLIGLLVSAYVPSYFKKKGENLATKEDIEEITKKIESVKADISQRLQVSQFRYQREFEILLELSAKTVDLRDATVSLRPSIDVSTGLPEDEEKKQRYGKWRDAGRKFYFQTERTRPFYPEKIFEEIKALEKLCHMELNRYRVYSSNPNHRYYDPKYWEEASQNIEKITAQADVVLIAIRERTKKWENI